MNRAGAWIVRGVGRETREIAEEAARRACMSLGDWLDEVVAEQAADQGVTADHRDEKLDAIGDRLTRVSRRESIPAAARRDAGEERQVLPFERRRSAQEARRMRQDPSGADDDRDDEDKLDAIGDRLARLWSRECADAETPAPGPEPKPTQEARRAQELLEAAVAKFESRAAKIEARTAKAFEVVASWIEQSQADRARERATLRSVAQKLADIEERRVQERPDEIDRVDFRSRSRPRRSAPARAETGRLATAGLSRGRAI